MKPKYCFTPRFLMRDGDAAQPAKNDQHENGVDCEAESHAPVFEEQHCKDAQQEQPVGDEVERELREEGRQFGHVAVDALDQFARR
ncbi:MAG TPA: hypothetical protein PLF42_11690, partial [Anaerolineales bacterium]|nr:hypothetical protein [Anaerolineales bacterium]